MTTTRTPISRGRKMNLTLKVIALYRAVLTSTEGNYNDAGLELHTALGRKPWNTDVLDTAGADEPPSWMHDARRRQDWLEAREILRQLDAAIAAG